MSEVSAAHRVVVAGGAQRVVVPGAAMIAVTFGLARYGYGLLLPDMQAGIRLSPARAGLIASGAYVSYLAANTATVWLTGRFGVRVPIAMAAALATAGMALVGLAYSAGGLALGVVVAGSAAGLAFPPYADVVSRTLPADRQATAWSAVSSGTGWGVALAGPVAIVLGAHWRIAWFVFAFLAAVVGLIAVRSAPSGLTRIAGAAGLDRRWFLCPRSRPLLVSAGLVGIGSSVWWAFSVAALRHGGLGSTTASIVYATCGVSGVLASGLGRLVGHAGLAHLYRTAVIAVVAALALLAFAPSVPAAALAAAVLFGLSYNSVIAVQGLWSNRVFAQRPSAGLAACNTALTLGTIAGPAMAGMIIHSAGYRSAFLLAAVPLGVALIAAPPAVPQPGR